MLDNNLELYSDLPLFNWALGRELKPSLYDLMCSCTSSGLICVRCQMLYVLEQEEADE